MLKNVAIRAILAHLKIVENHAFSQEDEGARNCLCKKVGPFVEACWLDGWVAGKVRLYSHFGPIRLSMAKTYENMPADHFGFHFSQNGPINSIS